MVAAEADPLDDRPLSVAQGLVADGTMTRQDIRLLLEIVRRNMWDEGEI